MTQPTIEPRSPEPLANTLRIVSLTFIMFLFYLSQTLCHDSNVFFYLHLSFWSQMISINSISLLAHTQRWVELN